MRSIDGNIIVNVWRVDLCGTDRGLKSMEATKRPSTIPKAVRRSRVPETDEHAPSNDERHERRPTTIVVL